MARPLEFRGEMGSPEAHLEVLESRIKQVEAEVEEAKARKNDALVADATRRLEELKAERDQFGLENQEVS